MFWLSAIGKGSSLSLLTAPIHSTSRSHSLTGCLFRDLLNTELQTQHRGPHIGRQDTFKKN